MDLSYPILSDSGNDRQSATLGLCPTQSFRIRDIGDSQPKTLDFLEFLPIIKVFPYVGKRHLFVSSDLFRFEACETVSYFRGLSKTLALLMFCPSLSIQIRAVIDSQRLLVFPYMEKRDFINVFTGLNNDQ